MALALKEEDYIEFKLPFSVDADRIIDAEGREICQISSLCSPVEAMRLAKLFAASYQAFTILAGVRTVIYNGTTDAEEDKEARKMCEDIDAFINSVFNESKPPSKIIEA